MSNAERRLTSLGEYKRAMADLENYLSDSSVGDPRFMAFWDLVDSEIAQHELDSSETLNPMYVGLQIKRARVALVADRISSKSSEIPDYYKASREIKSFIDTLMHAPASVESIAFDYLGRLRDGIAMKRS